MNRIEYVLGGKLWEKRGNHTDDGRIEGLIIYKELEARVSMASKSTCKVMC